MASERNSQSSWGTKQWFSAHFTEEGRDDPTAYFSHGGNGYQTFRRGQLVRLLKSRIKGRRIGRMLDIGCGTGDLAAALARDIPCRDAVGVDFVAELVESARTEHPDIEFCVGALPRLDFPAESFDLVVASEVLYYLNPEQREAARGEIRRVLRGDGLLLFSSALGARYFTTHGALEYLMADFEMSAVWHHHNRLYHGLTRPLSAAARLHSQLRNGRRASSPRLTAFVGRHSRMLRNRLVAGVLGCVALCARPMLRSSRLPRLLERVSRAVLPWWTRTNITIPARKKASQ